MEIGYAFFAEAAQTTTDGRLNLLGADIQMLQFQGKPPWIYPSIFLVANLQFPASDCGRLYHFVGDLLTPNDTMIEPHLLHELVVPLQENSEQSFRVNMVLHMTGVAFPGPGLYHMKIRVEDRERNIHTEKRVRLRLIGAESQPRATEETANQTQQVMQ